MKVIVQNIATEYLDEGHGPVLLFLHGWKDTLHSFDVNVMELKSSFRVVRLDLPGFGSTEAPKAAWDVGQYVAFVKDFIEKLELHVEAMIGHSFGGRIILKGAGSNQLLANKIILIGSAGIVKNKDLKHSVLKFFAKIVSVVLLVPPFSLISGKLKKWFYSRIGSDYMGTGELKETFKLVINEDLQKYAKTIQIPTLLVWGENDASTPVSDARLFETLIHNSKLTVLPDAGHFVHREKAEEVTTIIKNFL